MEIVEPQLISYFSLPANMAAIDFFHTFLCMLLAPHTKNWNLIHLPLKAETY